MSAEFANKLEKAKSLIKDLHYEEAVAALRVIIDQQVPQELEGSMKIKEKAIERLAKLFVRLNQPNELAAFLNSLRPYFDELPKAKTAKLVRLLIDSMSEIPNSEKLIISLCDDHINWANSQNRIVLRQRLEFKLAHAYYKTNNYKHAAEILSKLIKEIKRLDDKPMLVECYLLESKIYIGFSDILKSRAALSSARTLASSIYCPPTLQADLDTMCGYLHCEERDYKTAYSYFYEAFENYNSTVKEHTVNLHTSGDWDILNNPDLSFKERLCLQSSIDCLKYMLLCKIMDGVKEVQNLIDGKFALRYAIPELAPMREVAEAQNKSSLKLFKEAMDKHKSKFDQNYLLKEHLKRFYDSLLEDNLLKLIEPFSQVQICHISELIDLAPEIIEKKLTQMILDKKLDGILDQGTNCLIIFEESPNDSSYSNSLKIISEMEKVVDNLYNKASKLG